MTDTLPPGVTHEDIDKHFGEPDTIRVRGDVCIGLEVEVGKEATEKEMKDALIAAYEGGEGSVSHVEVIDAG